MENWTIRGLRLEIAVHGRWAPQLDEFYVTFYVLLVMLRAIRQLLPSTSVLSTRSTVHCDGVPRKTLYLE